MIKSGLPDSERLIWHARIWGHYDRARDLNSKLYLTSYWDCVRAAIALHIGAEASVDEPEEDPDEEYHYDVDDIVAWGNERQSFHQDVWDYRTWDELLVHPRKIRFQLGSNANA